MKTSNETQESVRPPAADAVRCTCSCNVATIMLVVLCAAGCAAPEASDPTPSAREPLVITVTDPSGAAITNAVARVAEPDGYDDRLESLRSDETTLESRDPEKPVVIMAPGRRPAVIEANAQGHRLVVLEGQIVVKLRVEGYQWRDGDGDVAVSLVRVDPGPRWASRTFGQPDWTIADGTKRLRDEFVQMRVAEPAALLSADGHTTIDVPSAGRYRVVFTKGQVLHIHTNWGPPVSESFFGFDLETTAQIRVADYPGEQQFVVPGIPRADIDATQSISPVIPPDESAGARWRSEAQRN